MDRPSDAHRTPLLIGLALPLGVTMFAVVAWLVRSQEPAPMTGPVVQTLSYAWIGFAAISSFAALAFFRSRVEPLIANRETPPADVAGQLAANLLICWALVEAAALLGVTIYFLTGTLWTAIAGVILMWSAFLATRPQPEWFNR
ncbi:MAG TPA: hypothetical protein VFZ51_01245 [Woeseiaceae bacterium]